MRRLSVLFAFVLLMTTSSAQAPLEFEAASIKRNTSDQFGPTPRPSPGHLTLTRIQARFIATRAFPDLTTPIQVFGLPEWADSERYDVVVTFNPAATAAQQQQMWRTFLADRMKLQAHYETRPRPGYRLVLARPDGKLGPQLKPSTLNCPPPALGVVPDVSVEARDAMLATVRDRRPATAPEEAVLLSQCGGTFNAWNTMYGGALEIPAFIRSLAFLGIDRPVIDGTGLEGKYSVKLWASRISDSPLALGSAAFTGVSADDAPSLFTAIEDQLGLKLEPTTVEGQVLVIDHIERPSEN